MITYKINGKVVTAKQWDAHPGAGLRFSGCAPMSSMTYSESNPLISDGVGCMKSQVPELRDTIRRHGIHGARVLNNGQIQFTSRRARRKLLRVRGLCDNDGGYSD